MSFDPHLGSRRHDTRVHSRDRVSIAAVVAIAIAAGAALPCRAASPASQKCSLLTSTEVEQAIGPHDGGKSDLGNFWALQGCRWTAVSTTKGAPEGWKDSIEVALFDEARTSWARDQATGEPVPELKGGKYNASYGDLWFDCAGNRVCVVKVRTASSQARQDTAKRLAHAVERRAK